jgi:hypothetical protein
MTIAGRDRRAQPPRRLPPRRGQAQNAGHHPDGGAPVHRDVPTSRIGARALRAAGLVVLATLSACAVEEGATPAATAATGPSTRFTFDADPAGRVPPGWTVAATRSGIGGPGAALATWAVVADASAPSPGHVLALSESRHGQQGTFNLCWTRDVAFRDGRLRVAVKAVGGEVDQGGGLVWRVRDADNYYVCRFNPLERNVRVYRVTGGVRHQLDTALVDAVAGAWHVLEVLVDGPRITCILDGATRLQAEDHALPDAGGVGLWTKADAVTSFDDLQVDDALTR